MTAKAAGDGLDIPLGDASALDVNADAVYAAEESACEHLFDRGYLDYDKDFLIDREEIPSFVATILEREGWENIDGGKPTLLEFAFDVPDGSEFAAVCRTVLEAGVTVSTIHLHPRLLDRWTVLHEVAHALVGNWHGHDSHFCSAFVGLVDAAWGRDAARVLIEEYESRGIEIDEGFSGLAEDRIDQMLRLLDQLEQEHGPHVWASGTRFNI